MLILMFGQILCDVRVVIWCLSCIWTIYKHLTYFCAVSTVSLAVMESCPVWRVQVQRAAAVRPWWTSKASRSHGTKRFITTGRHGRPRQPKVSVSTQCRSLFTWLVPIGDHNFQIQIGEPTPSVFDLQPMSVALVLWGSYHGLMNFCSCSVAHYSVTRTK